MNLVDDEGDGEGGGGGETNKKHSLFGGLYLTNESETDENLSDPIKSRNNWDQMKSNVTKMIQKIPIVGLIFDYEISNSNIILIRVLIWNISMENLLPLL